MNKDILIIHGFGPKEDDYNLINKLSTKGFNVTYFDWFNWNEISSEKFRDEIKKYIKVSNIYAVIGISFGGIVLGENIEMFSKIPVFLIASAPKFNPSKSISFLYKFPLGISKVLINLIKPITLLLSKLFLNSRFGNNMKLIYTLPTYKLISMIKYIKETNNSDKLKGDNLIVINGEYDFIMPPSNWDNMNIAKQITPRAYHHNVVNDQVIENIISSILS